MPIFYSIGFKRIESTQLALQFVKNLVSVFGEFDYHLLP